MVARGPCPLTGNGTQGQEVPVGVRTQAWVRMEGEFFRAALFLVWFCCRQHGRLQAGTPLHWSLRTRPCASHPPAAPSSLPLLAGGSWLPGLVRPRLRCRGQHRPLVAGRLTATMQSPRRRCPRPPHAALRQRERPGRCNPVLCRESSVTFTCYWSARFLLRQTGVVTVL